MAYRFPPGAERFNRRAQGAQIERSARFFLCGKGLTPFKENAHARVGEIDLVMFDGEALVFVEVRYRARDTHGGALASVDWHKQRKLIRAAEMFLLRHPRLAQRPCRFDVVCVKGDMAALEFRHIRDAFRVDDVYR